MLLNWGTKYIVPFVSITALIAAALTSAIDPCRSNFGVDFL